MSHRIRRKGVLRLISLVPMIGAIVAFILTEDMTAEMQLVDKFTILMIFILAVQIVIAAFAKVKKDDDDNEEQGEGAQA